MKQAKPALQLQLPSNKAASSYKPMQASSHTEITHQTETGHSRGFQTHHWNKQPSTAAIR